jgi:hypothetical protein
MLIKFKNNNARPALEEAETQFSLFSEQAAVRRDKEILKAVQRSFDVITSWRYPHSVVIIDIEGIVEALQKGVEIRVIMNKSDEENLLSDALKHLEKYSTFKIRYLLNPPKALMQMYDKKKAWVCTCNNPMLEECPTLRTNNPCLLSILQDYFEILWLTAMESNT